MDVVGPAMAASIPRRKGMAVTIREDVISEREWEQLGVHLGLSRQQTEIVRRLFLGRSEAEIAGELMLLPRAVRAQVERIYAERDLTNRLQLVLHVLAALRACWEQNDEPLSEPRGGQVP